jgi:hypothetical protein
LHEIDDALLKYSNVAAIPKAEKSNVEGMRAWIKSYPPLNCIRGPGSSTWGTLDPSKQHSEETHFLKLLYGLFLARETQDNCWNISVEVDDLILAVQVG